MSSNPVSRAPVAASGSSQGRRSRIEQFLSEEQVVRKETYWPLDVVMVLMGGLVLWMVVSYLKFNDPRWQYNAWTYLLSVPLILTLLSLVLRYIAGRFVERSMQVAFLLSVMVHLMLMVAAVKVVIFAKLWPDVYEAVSEDVAKEPAAKQYFTTASASALNGKSPSRPDYMRAIETKHEASEESLAVDGAMELAAREKAELPTLQPELKQEKVQAALMPKVEAVPTLTSNEPEMAELSRAVPEVTRQATSQIDVPEVPLERMVEPVPDQSVSDSLAMVSKTDLPNDPAALNRPDALKVLQNPPVAAGVPKPELADRKKPGFKPEDISNEVPEIKLQKSANVGRRSGGARSAPVVEQVAKEANSQSPAASSSEAIDALANMEAVAESRSSSNTQAVTATDLLRSKAMENLASNRAMPSAASALSIPRRERDAIAEGTADGLGGATASPVSRGKQLSGPIVKSLGGNKKIDLPVKETSGESKVGESGDSGTADVPSEMVADADSLNGIASEILREQAMEGGRARSPSSGAQRPLDVKAEEGLGGLAMNAQKGNRITERAELQPLTVPEELITQRFVRDNAGALRGGGAGGPVPRPAFQQRMERTRQGDSSSSGSAAGPRTEESIELGLAFLAQSQRADGRWRLQDFDTKVLVRSDTAATALSLLAFQGAGYTHRQFKYASTVGKGIDFLVANQKPDGDLYIPQDPASDQNGWLYSHSIATLALCEAYGMTQDPTLKEPAQRAVKFIVAAQDPQRGGWRYRPGRGSDTSVTGWFALALQSAQLSGLQVPPTTRAGIDRWLTASRGLGDEEYLYRYNPNAADTPSQRHGLVPNPTMTSVGMLTRLYSGAKKQDAEIVKAADYLLQHLPSEGNSDKSQRDTYYWYYSTQAMFHMGGDYWEQWNGKLYPLLVNSQVKSGPYVGSWEPLGDVPDLWGQYGGRLYVTTMNLLSLEVYYRHLPLYEAPDK